MKTNIEVVNHTYCAPIGIASFYTGSFEDGESIVEICDVYRKLNGTEFAYCNITKEVVVDYTGVIYYKNSVRGHKRGRHANSNNKKAVRHAELVKGFEALDDLPF